MRSVHNALIKLCLVPLGAAALVACTGDDIPPAATPSASASLSSGAASPSPNGPTGPVGPSTPTALDGTAFYYAPVEGGRAIQVWSLRGAVATKHHRIPVPDGDYCVDNSVIVSPDGQWLAWVTGTGAGDTIGKLSVSSLDGRNPRTLDDVVCAAEESTWASENVWTPDSRQLKVDQFRSNTRRHIAIDVRTGAVESRPASDGVVWSANRDFNVRGTGEKNAFIVRSADGRVVHTVKNYRNELGGFEFCGYTLKGVSDDGRYVTIGQCGTDPSRILGASLLFDAQANRHVTLPAAGVDSITFVGGAVVVHSSRSLTLMSPAGSVIARLTEPAALPNNARFLSYTPAA